MIKLIISSLLLLCYSTYANVYVEISPGVRISCTDESDRYRQQIYYFTKQSNESRKKIQRATKAMDKHYLYVQMYTALSSVHYAKMRIIFLRDKGCPEN